ncbi:MAG TPA: SDR family oxidoreductase [Candidatus Tumulicola sp.]|nr:SDR family oxidoreductase [Candidatus Tumulicola sp.]
MASSDRLLRERVAIVTGASRGIGRAFALRLAREGATVVIAAKSERPREKLPGSIYSVAAEVEALGGRALAVRADVRNDEDVRALVDQTIERFGRLDILVNNAGALWWEQVIETPPKRFDLMWQVNVRAAYLCSYYALPHMVARKWGHIVNCSPPISTTANPGYVCYMITKMGMSRLAIGIAAEHSADNVAANSLWPATPIESQATINWEFTGKVGSRGEWRSPEILCDALMEIVTSEPSALTGRELIDETFLRERGWSEERLASYWLSGEQPKEPIYIDGREQAKM